ncbi:MAG: bifunctional (p)ppGpp synthetase/guanosine-3',5'-bis(diphosphate) 3'-pyrophosphohydrolase [Parasporobacterium sp.]|nr:bifunctional (p)ppGpp synthetase/guanosine-3',5'-bis(diphosphate) 3'-pyrophosphohydrolase [Parasporobacterium sp.]
MSTLDFIKKNKHSAEYLPKLIEKTEPEDVEKLHEQLMEMVSADYSPEDVATIEKAYQLAKECHKDQKRKSGEPYIIHPVHVAMILSEMDMDRDSIVAGLLHDVVEDTPMTLAELKTQFGEDVAELVDGVTKLTQIKYVADKVEVQAENLRKMFLAMAKDLRVIIIKLADRTHNMRTLQHMRREKQIEKAKETMEIYAPLCKRLGISRLKTELDDSALMYLEPDVFYLIKEDVSERKNVGELNINDQINEVRECMARSGIKCEIDGRVKHYFSIYKKMINQDKNIDEIYDLFAVRIMVDSIKDCYGALGAIHEVYKPIPGRFKDYIAMPKLNNYQSLHTTILSHTGQPFEVQIRTYEMHRTAEYGVAAHWKYKEGKGIGDKTMSRSEEEKIAWLRRILDWQKDTSDNREFMEFIKNDFDLFADQVFCFTPQGDVKCLPAGSTPIDLAYNIHSAIGNKMVGARVNDRIVNIDYQIQNGDRVEIITSQNSKGPSLDWLNIVKSSGARSKINQWFRNVQKDDNVARGKELIEKYLKSKGINEPGIFASEFTDKILARYSFKDWDAVLAAIGHGGLKEGQIINRLLDDYNRKYKKNELTDEDVLENAAQAAISSGNSGSSSAKHRDGIVVKGIHDVAVRFSKCCSPLPGDEIVGFVTRGRGVTIHRTDCVNVLNMSSIDRVRLIDAEWDKPSSAFKEEKYEAGITIYAENKVGLLVEVSKVMSSRGMNINKLISMTNKQNLATIEMSFNVASADELAKVIEKLNQIDGVEDIQRTTGG